MSEVNQEDVNMDDDHLGGNVLDRRWVLSTSSNVILNQQEPIPSTPTAQEQLCNSVSELLTSSSQSDNRDRTLALFRVTCYPQHSSYHPILPPLTLSAKNIEKFGSSIVPDFMASWEGFTPNSLRDNDGPVRRRLLMRRIGGQGNTYSSRLQVIDEAGGIQPGKYVHFGRIEEHRLMKAAFFNNIDLASELLGKGANTNASDHHGRTALHLAASKGYVDMVKLLLENKANPNAKDKVGNTPLHLAACTNDVDVVLILLKAGAKVTATDRAGKSPLQLALSKLEMFRKTSSTSASVVLKEQMTKVVDMLLAALHNVQKEESAEAELLKAFQNSLTITETEEQVSQQVDSLSNILNKMKDLDIQC